MKKYNGAYGIVYYHEFFPADFNRAAVHNIQEDAITNTVVTLFYGNGKKLSTNIEICKLVTDENKLDYAEFLI